MGEAVAATWRRAGTRHRRSGRPLARVVLVPAAPTRRRGRRRAAPRGRVPGGGAAASGSAGWPARRRPRAGGVREVVAARRLADDPAAPELVERPDHGPVVEVRGLHQQREAELMLTAAARTATLWATGPISSSRARSTRRDLVRPTAPRCASHDLDDAGAASPPVAARRGPRGRPARVRPRTAAASRAVPPASSGSERDLGDARAGGSNPRRTSRRRRPRRRLARRRVAGDEQRRVPRPARGGGRGRRGSPGSLDAGRRARAAAAGRPAGNAWVSPSTNWWRRHASGVVRAPSTWVCGVDRGTSRSTSARQTGSI